MFYSETLLAKTGPLAKVWLAANLERKLTKQNVLSSDLGNNVEDIIGQGQAPMALRLSGQLLLGVVKIYSKKAKYLLDDCSEALNRIRVAFKPGNVDLPSNQTHIANSSTLMQTDAVDEIDLFAPLDGPEHLLLDSPEGLATGLNDPTLLTDASQFLSQSQTPRKQRPTFNLNEEDDLGLDIGEYIPGGGIQSTPLTVDRSIEVGRREHTPRRDEPTSLLDDDLGLDIGDGDTTLRDEQPVMPNDNDDFMMTDAEDGYQPPPLDDDFTAQNTAAFARVQAAEDERRQQRDSASPLSSIRPSVERELEASFRPHLNGDLEDDEDEQDPTMAQAAQRVKRRKVMQQDHETEIPHSQIKKLQEDRSAITRAPTFLPRDPLLLQLMELQRSGTFVSNIIGDGRMAGLAPELRGILSLEVIARRAGEKQKKRKRDSGIADVDGENESSARTPEIELPLDEDEEGENDFAAGAGIQHEDEAFADGANINAADDDEFDLQIEDDDDAAIPFDTTEAPLLHPSQTGPVSLGTQTAVHALRSFFAPSHPPKSAAPPSPSARVNASAKFTDLCPEETTGRNEATKMFFELLVLGTKDAVKIEQESKGVGLPIRVRGKRGLWGEWAERGVVVEQEAAAAGQGQSGALRGEQVEEIEE